MEALTALYKHVVTENGEGVFVIRSGSQPRCNVTHSELKEAKYAKQRSYTSQQPYTQR